MRNLFLTNTLSRQKELFVPVNPGHVGMYVCGPTVYGDAHLGHARPGVTYDVLFKLLRHLGYKVRYVRNITDVGHLEHDSDDGEDKIAKKARLEQLEPMEVVQTYTLRYHEAMRMLNVAPPSIEPRASGHIIEHIETVKRILSAGYAYKATEASTSMSESTTMTTSTASFRDVRWMTPWRAPARLTARRTRERLTISPSGRRRNRSTS